MKTAPDTHETTCCTVSNMDTFRVESRDGFGKVLIANTLLPKGEIVFSNAPFSWLLRGDYSGSRCGTCFKTPKSSNLLLCAKCKSIQYCSATCQRADWSQHKSECSKMPDIRSLKMSSNCVDDVLLLNRTLVVQKKSIQQCEKHIHPYLGRHITSCGSDHLSSMSIGGGDRTDEMVAVIAATCRVFGHTVPAVAQLMAQFRSNNFGVLSDLMGCIGVGVYPEAALLNHSCAPTCLLTYTLTQDGPIANVSIK
jgi:SET and MYND domain-containing protein